MFYALLYPLKETFEAFNLFKYITFRAAAASVTAFLLCLILGPFIINFLKKLSCVEAVKREHAEKIEVFYAKKKDTPTMGGLLMISSVLISCFLWGNLSNRLFWISLATLLWFGALGFADDYLKVKMKDKKGLMGKTKMAGQLIFGALLAVYLYLDPAFAGKLYVPFFKNLIIPLGLLYIPFVAMVLTGSSNALNLTDGLDGLAVGCMIFAAGAFAVIAYVSGHVDFARYLQIPFFAESGELAVFCLALVGAGVGFLWYNSYPASVFMGDTGSLSLGSALGVIAVLIQKELVLVIVGGVFVWEALSVIIQVVSFRCFGRRVFLMSPYHHHLQLKGWPESKVTVRLWIVAFILALVGLSTLKLR